MGTRKTPSAPSAALVAPAAADTVELHCEDLGETRPFTPDHAARILAYQEKHCLTGPGSWQPVAADSSDSK